MAANRLRQELAGQTKVVTNGNGVAAVEKPRCARRWRLRRRSSPTGVASRRSRSHES